MKKLLIILITCISILFPITSQAKILTEDEKVQFAMLMNQVQYTTANIIRNKDKQILNQEFDFVINQIDKSKLVDSSVKNAYTDLLNTIKELKLTDNEKLFVMEMNEREKKQAYSKAFSSFGSVFNSGFTPAALITSLAYAGVSAGLNIMSAKYEADDKLCEQLFQLEQKETETIDEYRIDLFECWTNVITTYGIPTNYEISEQEMKDLVDKLSDKQYSPTDLITILESKKRIFSLLPVYWYQLGLQYQLSNNFIKALECYDQFEVLTNRYSYLKTDTYYLNVAKNRLQILKEYGQLTSNSDEVSKYIKIIEENLIPENESENRLFLAGIYYELSNNAKAKDLLRLNIARNEFYSVSTEMLALIEYEENKQLSTLNPSILLELNATDLYFQDNQLEYFIPSKFSSEKYVFAIVDGNIYTEPYNFDKHGFPFSSNNMNFLSETSAEDTSSIIDNYKEYNYFNNSVTLDKKVNHEIILGILSDDSELIQLTYDCNYFEKNNSILELLTEVGMNLSDIDPCLLPSLFDSLESFSYKATEDKEYTELVDTHKKQISKQTSKEQKSVFEKEEQEKLKELKVKGRLRAISEVISNISSQLPKYPYANSKLSINSKGNYFCYSLKKIEYMNETYTFSQYGVATKNQVSEPTFTSEIMELLSKSKEADNEAQYSLYSKYISGDGVDLDIFTAYKYLILSAKNGNVTAQYELANIYANPKSELTNSIIAASIVIPDVGVKASIINLFKSNETITREKIASYWYEKATSNGNGLAVFEYAKRLEAGLGVQKNSELSQEYYRKAYYDYGIPEAEKKITQ